MAKKDKQFKSGHGSFFKMLALLITIVLGLGAIVTGSCEIYEKCRNKSIATNAFSIGEIDSTGAVKDGTSSLYSDPIKTEGLRCTLQENAKIVYRLYFYDDEGALLSASERLNVAFEEGALPEGATTVRVVVIPTEDEDGKITEFEKSGYADQLKITIKR